MVENLLATVAQHQREKNGQQTANRMRGRKLNGYWAFYPPVGHRFEKQDGHGKLLVPNEPDASHIKDAFEGYAPGRFESLGELQRFFERTDVLTKSKRGEVHLTRIQEMLSRAIHSGYIDHKPWGLRLIKAKHKPLISLETWQAVQEKLCLKATAKALVTADISEDISLRGFANCGDCGQAYTACWSKGRHKHYPCYLCDTKGCPSYRKSIRREEIEGEFETLLKSMQPSRELFDLSLAIFQRIWSDRDQQALERRKAVQSEIRTLDRKQEQLLDRIVNTNNTSVAAAYENRIAELQRKKAVLTERINKMSVPKGSLKQIYRTAFAFLANLWNLGVPNDWKTKERSLNSSLLTHAYTHEMRVIEP